MMTKFKIDSLSGHSFRDANVTAESLNKQWNENDMSGIKDVLLNDIIHEKHNCLVVFDEIAFVENPSMYKFNFDKDISKLCNDLECTSYSFLVFLDDGHFKMEELCDPIIRMRAGQTVMIDSDYLYAVNCKRYIKLKLVWKGDVEKLGSVV